MNLVSVVMTKFRIALSKINALPFPVHDKIRSDQRTDKTGSIMSPKRRTLREPRSPRGSGTINIVWSFKPSNKILHFFPESLRLCRQRQKTSNLVSRSCGVAGLATYRNTISSSALSRVFRSVDLFGSDRTSDRAGATQQ